MILINIISISVYFFLGHNCPISKSSTPEINRIYNHYSKNNNCMNDVKFFGIFPNPDSDSTSINNFKKTNKIQFVCLIDTNQYYTKKYNATTLPQIIIVDNAHNIQYSGKIDDLYYDLGKRNQGNYEKIAFNKIDSILSKLEIQVKYIKPIGCIIEKIK